MLLLQSTHLVYRRSGSLWDRWCFVRYVIQSWAVFSLATATYTLSDDAATILFKLLLMEATIQKRCYGKYDIEREKIRGNWS